MDKKDKNILNLKLDVDSTIPPEVAEEKLLESKESYKELTKKKDWKKKLLSLVFLLINILAVVVIALLEFTGEGKEAHSIGDVLAVWGKNWRFLIVIACLIILFYLLDISKLSLLMKASTGKFRWRVSCKSCIMCRYYDNITPFGSGGQPFQMYYLSRKISIGHATSLPLIHFFITQFAFFCLCIVDFVFFPADVSPAVRLMAYGGAVLYIIVPFLAILFSFIPKVMDRILRFVIKLGSKLHLIKDPEKTFNKWVKNVLEYRDVFKLFVKNLGIVLVVFILAVLQFIVLHSVPYFVFRACGVTDVDWWTITVMTTYIYSAISFIPTPGNSGAAEGTFYALFAVLGGYLFWGMLLWRFAVFYIVIFFGLVIIFLDAIKKYRRLSHISNAKIKEAEPPEE